MWEILTMQFHMWAHKESLLEMVTFFYTSSTSLHSNKTYFSLYNVLHTLSLNANLIYVQKLCLENNVFIEFHTHYFCVKDNNTIKMIHQGMVDCGLFKFIRNDVVRDGYDNSRLLALNSTWHDQLGHVSDVIVNKFLHSIDYKTLSF